MADTTPVIRGRSKVMYRSGGREYPLKHVGNCKVCNSPHRFTIEGDIVGGRVYRKIVESLPEGHGLTARNIQDHYYNGHLPLDRTVVRDVVERRAEAVGKNIADGVESLVDGMALAEVVVMKTFEAIAAGEISVDVKDGMAAAKFLAEMGAYDQGGADMAAITEAFVIYHENAQAFMSPDQYEAFGRELDRNPVLRALAARFEGQQEAQQPPQPRVVQGEVEDSTPGVLDNDEGEA